MDPTKNLNTPPPRREQSTPEQEARISVRDLALLAEFFKDQLQQQAEARSDERMKKNLEKRVRIMNRVQQIVTDSSVAGYKEVEELLKSVQDLENGYEEAFRNPRPEEEEEIEIGLEAMREARNFIEQNRTGAALQRRDFVEWLTKNKEKEVSVTEVDARFSDQSIKNVDEIRRVVTPEVKKVVLSHILKAIDARVMQGKGLALKTPGTAVEARKMVTVLGNEVLGRRYQFIASATEGKIIDAKDVAGMKVDEFLKKYLGYDLRTDQVRKGDLDKYTNILD